MIARLLLVAVALVLLVVMPAVVGTAVVFLVAFALISAGLDWLYHRNDKR